MPEFGHVMKYMEVGMKVGELIEKLMEVDPEFEVVLTIHEEGNITAWDSVYVDQGWEPSGVVSLESNHCCME